MEVETVTVYALASAIVGSTMFFLLWLLEPVVAAAWPRKPVQPDESFGQRNVSQAESTDVGNSLPVDLSVVVMAKNEEARLAILLDDIASFFRQRELTRSNKTSTGSANFSYEVIVVDIASTDATPETVIRFSQAYSEDQVKLLRLNKQVSRGLATRHGVMKARGKYILVMEANGCVPFEEIVRLEHGMKSIESRVGYGVVFGSRAYLHLSRVNYDKNSDVSSGQRFFHSTFTIMFQILCIRDVYDTQCPFKLFSRNAARRLFMNQRLQTIGSESELLYLAARMQIPLKEQAVEWNSSFSEWLPVRAYLDLTRDLVIMWAWYIAGFWRINTSSVSTSLGMGPG